MLWNRGSGYKAYVFKESTRHYAIDYKGRGRKEVIYLRVANVSCTRDIYKSTGLSYRGSYGRVPWQKKRKKKKKKLYSKYYR